MFREVRGIPPAISHAVANRGAKSFAAAQGLVLTRWETKFQFPRCLLGLPKQAASVNVDTRSIHWWSGWRDELSRELISFGAYLSNSKLTPGGVLSSEDSNAIGEILEIVRRHHQQLRSEPVGSHMFSVGISVAHYSSTLNGLMRAMTDESNWRDGLLTRHGYFALKSLLEDARDPVRYIRRLAAQRASIGYDDALEGLSLRNSTFSYSVLHLIADVVDLAGDADLTFGWDARRRVITVTLPLDSDQIRRLCDNNIGCWWLERSAASGDLRMAIPVAPMHSYEAWESLTRELRQKAAEMMPIVEEFVETKSLDQAKYKTMMGIAGWIAKLERVNAWSLDVFRHTSFDTLWRAACGEKLEDGDDVKFRKSLEWMADRIEGENEVLPEVGAVWTGGVAAHLSVDALRGVAASKAEVDAELMQGLRWFVERALYSRGVFEHLFERARLDGAPEGVVVRGLMERFNNILMRLYGVARLIDEREHFRGTDLEWWERNGHILERSVKRIASNYERFNDPLRRLERSSFEPLVGINVDLPDEGVLLEDPVSVNAVLERIILLAAYLPERAELELSYDPVNEDIVVLNEDGRLGRFLSDAMFPASGGLGWLLTGEIGVYAVKNRDGEIRRISIDADGKTVRVPARAARVSVDGG